MSTTATTTVNLSESQGQHTTAISIVFAVLTFIIITLRLFSRIFVVQNTGLDDVLMTVAAFLSWAFIIVAILAVQHGLGDHIEKVEALGTANFMAYTQLVWLSSIFYNSCLGFIKLSILALYSRLGDPTLRRMALIMVVVVGCQCSANVLTCIFQCNPVSGAWNVSLKAKCVNINAFYLSNAALNIFTDLITYILPIWMVLGLHTPARQKFAIIIMFGLGFFACISSIVRITFLPNMLTNSDATWAIAKPMYWSVIETNVAILAASIPSLKPLAHRYLPRLISEYNPRGNYLSSTPKDSTLQRRQFSNIDNNMALRPLGNDGLKTTVAVGKDSDTGELTKSTTGSEQDLVALKSQSQITQWTTITQKFEPAFRKEEA